MSKLLLLLPQFGLNRTSPHPLGFSQKYSKMEKAQEDFFFHQKSQIISSIQLSFPLPIPFNPQKCVLILLQVMCVCPIFSEDIKMKDELWETQ